MNFLLYHARTRPTGQRIAQYLGFDHGTEMTGGDRPDYLIRWGSAAAVPLRPAVRAINGRGPITTASSKQATFEALGTAGLRIPEWVVGPGAAGDDVLPFDPPYFLRKNNTFGGRNTLLVLNGDIDRRLDNGRYDIAVVYVPKQREFRIHVCGNRSIRAQCKEYRGEAGQYNPAIWNHDAGFHFVAAGDDTPANLRGLARMAIAGLDLDFGAVDIIEDTGGLLYILEVNTGPGLVASGIEAYGRTFANMCNLDEIPGMAAVDLGGLDEAE
jgi:hypothetical protein